ncbi:nucleotidyltransferase domain-containing protein [Flagellatimonas centrodinii]|uniref:type VII toxin-antitoxin system MntA family adenylyltransferase antitoxin n=1 Tax=Flagellatimonas centrodinii TaxID=2806210 RepID=UPI001FEDAC51|nr:nucleotidyltransferase domain-containing protein [Flagellatimonas centrodinii]ULQ48132.1 nucleotidyltransferase domain-containing protein [Flagellatimonas centrodinii]
MTDHRLAIVDICTAHYPALQAVYLFGSQASALARPDSDTDIALLLPHAQAASLGSLDLYALQTTLEGVLMTPVDLINLRRVSTVFAKEIIAHGVRLAAPDMAAADEFEAMTLSFYQALNRERAAILEAFRETGKAYAV